MKKSSSNQSNCFIMTTKMTITGIVIIWLFCPGLKEARGQWAYNGNHIYNTNAGNVGIGTSTPASLLYVAKNMTEPTITIRNLGGSGGATFSMIDDASGADWKFKATLTGGFKIRDNASALDILSIDPNSFANAIYIKNTGNIGIGTATPDNSALVDMTSTSKGFQPPQMTQAQIASISSPANGLLVFCTTDEKFYIYISNANAWKELLFGTGTIAPPFPCGNSITVNHVAGNVAPVTKTVTYGTVNNIPGETARCWITRNLGADNQATAVSDATEASAGWYWQFNRIQGYKHDGTTRTPNTTWITWSYENFDWQSNNDPCMSELGPGWRLPASSEWGNVIAAGGWTDWNGPWNSALKLHAAGRLYGDNGTLNFRGSRGFYWSSTQDSFISDGWYLLFNNTGCSMYYEMKASALSIRCINN